MTPIKLLTLSLLTINLTPIHGTVFNEQFISTENFIDKSLMIKEFFQRDRRVFITAPSGFGKTTNLQMMKKFCQMEFDSNYSKSISPNDTNACKIFKNLKIFEYQNIVIKHMAQHPVIFLDMKLDIELGKEINDDNIWQKYKIMLINAVSEYKNLIFHLIKLQGQGECEPEKNSTKVNDYRHELDVLSRLVKGELLDAKDNVSNRVIFRDCVVFLGKILHGYYNSSAVLLIDNYDYIVHNSFMESKGHLSIVTELLKDNIMQIFKTNLRQIMYIMIASVTTIGYQSFGLEKYFTGYYFYDDHPYTSHFGLIQQEIDHLLEKFNRDGSNSSLIKQICNGYETKLRYLSVYNTSCAIEYLKNPTTDTQITYQAIDEPNFIVKLFNEPEYLDQVCKLIKDSPTRHGSHEFVSFDHFSQLVKDDFHEPKFTSGLNASAFSVLVQQGFLGPIRGRYAFHIPNQSTRIRFIQNMRYYYEKIINIDLKLIGSYLYDIFASIKANSTAKPDLNQYLTKAFGQLKPFNISNELTNSANRTKKIKPPLKNQTITNQTLSFGSKSLSVNKIPPNFNHFEASQKFAHQLIIHLGALTNPNLKVIEDYPQPISYERSTANMDRRCVTCITHDNIALIVKNTDRAGFKVAEERARKYYKYSEPGIDHVWYLTIHVDDQKRVSSSVTKNVIVPVGNGSKKSNRKKKSKPDITTILSAETTIGLEW